MFHDLKLMVRVRYVVKWLIGNLYFELGLDLSMVSRTFITRGTLTKEQVKIINLTIRVQGPGSLSRCQGLQALLFITGPSLMLLVTPAHSQIKQREWTHLCVWTVGDQGRQGEGDIGGRGLTKEVKWHMTPLSAIGLYISQVSVCQKWRKIVL